MEEPFKMGSNTLTVNFSAADAQMMNTNLAELQGRLNRNFASARDLFNYLWQCSQDLLNAPEPTPAELPANAMLVPDDFAPRIDQVRAMYPEQLPGAATVGQVISFAIDRAITPPIQEMPEPVIERVEVDKPLGEHQYLLTLTDEPKKPIEKKEVLIREIQKRRALKFGRPEEPLNELLEKMIFNDGTIFNLGGEFYTGF